MISWTRPPAWLRRCYPASLWQVDSPTEIVLSFDDGPGPLTAAILEWAQTHGAGLLFFLSPDQAERQPDLARAAVRAGHIVGTHFPEHRSYFFTGRDAFLDALRRSAARLEDIIDQPVRLCRAPYGRLRPAQDRWLRESGFRHIFWSLDSGDYRREPREKLPARLRAELKAGDIVLLHDGPVHHLDLPAVLTSLFGEDAPWRPSLDAFRRAATEPRGPV